MDNLKTAVVEAVEEQGDRTLIYLAGHKLHSIMYYAIAKPDCDVKVGDSIAYEPMGFNFGWFANKVENESEVKEPANGES